MLFFVVDPACELIGVLGRIFRKFIDLFHGLGDGFLVLVHGGKDVVIGIDSARDLAVS